MTETPDHLTRLDDLTPFAIGNVREVYERPGHPGQVIKAIRQRKRDAYAAQTGTVGRIRNTLMLGPYRTFWIEYRCYIRTAHKALLAGRPNPIAAIGELVLTDRGLAQVSERITDGRGGLAEQLFTLQIEGRLTENLVARLNAFVADVFALNVNVPDLFNMNVVYDGARERFVLIDGYGDKTLIPARAWIRPINQRRLEERFARMEREGGLTWHAAERRFTFGDGPGKRV